MAPWLPLPRGALTKTRIDHHSAHTSLGFHCRGGVQSMQRSDANLVALYPITPPCEDGGRQLMGWAGKSKKARP